MRAHNFLGRKFVTFLAVGVLNTVIGGSIIAGGIFLGVQPLIANAIGFICGICVSFFLNSRLTFRGPQSLTLFARYITAFLIAYLCNLAAVLAVAPLFPEREAVIWVLGIVPYTIVFFTLAHFFVFGTGASKAGAR